jgi:hypothetical protein
MNGLASTLHITNGDIVAVKLRAAVHGQVSITADVLHEGPAAALDGPGWREQRALYLASAGYTTVDEARSTLDVWDAAINSAGDYDETVLWFEHDLFDQLLLVRTLEMLGGLRYSARPLRVSLICINTYLGTLTAAELGALWLTRAPITDAQYRIARRVWWAYRLPDPSELLAARSLLGTARDDRLPFPFLGDALDRFFEEFPSTTNGLGRTADAVLQELDLTTTLVGGDLFRRTQLREPRVFLGDAGLFHIVRDMARMRVPLVDVPDASGRSDLASQPISITAAGRAVARADRDAIGLNGIDIWRGGVHLSGRQAPWRWDPARKTLVSCK